MRISSRALISATALASALALAGLGVAPAYAADLSLTQSPSTTDVQLGHKFTIDVTVTNNDTAASTITVVDKLPAGVTFWGITINDPNFKSITTCTTPAKNHNDKDITCVAKAPANTFLPTGTFSKVATVTLKARQAGTWTLAPAISDNNGAGTADLATVNVHTGKGHPKTGPQANPNNGQDNGQQNGQGKTNNNGHPNKGNNGAPATSNKGHTK